MKKFLALLIACLMLLSVCAFAEAEKPKVEAHIFQFKVDTIDQMQNLANMFAAQYDKADVTITVETIGGSGDFGAALATKYAAGDIPDMWAAGGANTIMEYAEGLTDLRNEPWLGNVVEGMLDPVTLEDGTVLGQPLCIEAYGYIYNVELFEKAGITEAPKNFTELVAVCEKLEAAGIRPFTNGYAEGWIIAQHFFNGAFLAEIGGSIAKDLGVTDSLANYPEEVAEMVALLQLTAKYGGGEATLATDYNTTLSEFANGEAAMLQQGTWIQPSIDALNPDLKVGMFGFVMNDDEDANVIPVGNAGYWVIPEQSSCPEVMKDFLTWMATDEAAINSIINDFAFIPAFTGIDYDLGTIGSIYAALQPYIQEGKTSEWIWDTLPNGFGDFLCPAFQQVAIEMISVEEFIAECDTLIADAR